MRTRSSDRDEPRKIPSACPFLDLFKERADGVRFVSINRGSA
jgi:hypothetical protein